MWADPLVGRERKKSEGNRTIETGIGDEAVMSLDYLPVTRTRTRRAGELQGLLCGRAVNCTSHLTLDRGGQSQRRDNGQVIRGFTPVSSSGCPGLTMSTATTRDAPSSNVTHRFRTRPGQAYRSARTSMVHLEHVLEVRHQEENVWVGGCGCGM